MTLEHMAGIKKANDNRTNPETTDEKLKIEKIWDKPEDVLEAIRFNLARQIFGEIMHKAFNRGWWIGFIMGIAACAAAYAIVLFNN